jgi:hypothetical protein
LLILNERPLTFFLQNAEVQMERKSWVKILSGCSMAALILAGCGGGGGGGGGAAPITTPAQAQQAAISTSLVLGNGLSSLVSPPGSSFSKKFAVRIASENLPTMDGYFAMQKFLTTATRATTVQKAAITSTNCSGGGSKTVDSGPVTGGFKTTTTYNACREGNLLTNGISSSEEIIGATSSHTEITGNGDQDVNDAATDLVMTQFGADGTTVVSIWKSSSTDKWNDTVVSETATLRTSNSSSSFKGMFTFSDATNATTFSVSANMSDTGTSQSTLNSSGGQTGSVDESVTNGTMALSGAFSGQNIGLTFTANNLKTKDTYTSTLTGETGTWEGNGSFATDMTPGTCLDGAFAIKTITPVQHVDNYATGQSKTTAGEIELNGASRVVMSNNGTADILTIFLGTNPTPVFTGTEAELMAQTAADCPIFGLAGAL